MNFKNTIYYFSTALVVIFFLYLQGILWVLQLIVFMLFYWTLFYGFHLLWIKIKKKEKDKIKYPDYVIEFWKKMSLWFIIVTIILSSFAYYQNEKNPAQMPEFTISNWDKTIIFQAMSHIWNKDFYEQIRQNLISAKEEWYVYFFEWVTPGTEENAIKFNEAIGIKFEDDLYENFSKLYWVSYQDNRIYYGLVNDLDFNVDVSMDYIMEEYDRQVSMMSWSTNPAESKLPLDANKQIIESLATLNDKELKLLVYINQAILNFIIKSNGLQDLITENFSNNTLFDIIIDWRNDVLANEIIESEYDKIYVTYWLLHFEWVMKILSENDSAWKIINTNYLIPIQ